MGLPQFCIKKPVTTIMIMSFIILFGVISLMGLPQELFPPITYPQLTVVTIYGNAAPEEIETLITKPVEEAVGTVSGLRRVKSISKEGTSMVMAEFGWSEDMDFASLKLREKIDLIKARLPREAGEPLVMKYNPFERPIMTLSITGKRSSIAVREITRRIIKDELEKVEGVASAGISGGFEREILVSVDQARLNAQRIPIMDVVNAITNANLNYPAGTIKESFYEYLIRTLGEFENVSDIDNIPVKTYKEQDEQQNEEQEIKKIAVPPNMVLMKDIADVIDTHKEITSYSRYNGSENISVSIQKQAQTNTLQVVNRIRKTIDFLNEELPSDIKMTIIDDQSTFIKESINGVRDAAVQGGILAFIVLFLFLRNAKSSGIVTLSMPISIMFVFVAMYFFGISLNMMSLGGLALGIGMLVDNAIVVLENITRHRDAGKAPKDAAQDGASEVANAISSSTLTTIAVFFPMVFVVGMAGQIFKQLAFTVIFALIASLIVALSLIPLLAARVGKVKMAGMEPDAPTTGYVVGFEWFLKLFLRKRGIGFLVIIVIFCGSMGLFTKLDKELMPKMDQGQFTIKVNMLAGTRLEVTDRVVSRIEDFILSLPDVRDTSVIVGSTRGKGSEDVMQRLGSNEGEIIIRLKPDRKLETKEVVQIIEKQMDKIELERARIEYLLSESVFSGAVAESSPIVVEVKGKKIPVMLEVVKKVEGMLKAVQGIYGVKSDMPEASPETKIIVDKDKAALFQMSVVDLAQTTQVALKGYIASEFKEKGEEVDIRVRLRAEDRDDFEKLARIQLSTPTGIKIPLTSIVKFERGEGPSEIKRSDQERTILVSANIFKRALKDVSGEVVEKLERLNIPEDDAVIKLAGESEDMKESFNSLMGALILSIILVYMIMAAQFESFWQPFIIMFTVPLSLIGVVFALLITKTSLNVIVFLGVIMLGGIVVNNGIVLIDYINLLLGRGMGVYESVIEASKSRLRPILMTAMTTVLGLLPMALAFGEGAELRAPLAISVMGGLFVTTFLSLLVIPAIFLATHELRVKLFKK